MRKITYLSPKTVKEACELLDTHNGARILAGGTDILVKWKRTGAPDMTAVDVSRIDEIKGIKQIKESGDLWIGAGTALAEIADSPLVKTNVPILAEAARSVGSVQIRNMATIGGNVGNAAPSADTVLPLLVFETSVKLSSLRGERIVPLNEFFAGPGKTNIECGELITGFLIPPEQQGNVSSAAFTKHSRRAGMDVATVGTSVRVVKNQGRVVKCLIALGAVAPIPTLITLDPSLSVDEMVEKAIAKVSPISDIRGTANYRNDMIRVRLVQNLEQVLA